MTVGLLFWLLWIVFLVLSFVGGRGNLRGWGTGDLLFFVLTGLLGFGVFGWPIHR